MRLLIESLRGISHERVESDQVLVRQPTAQIGTLAFGKAVYDQRRNLGLSVVDLTGRAGMAADEVECIEEGGTEPSIALLRRLAAPLDADVHLNAGDDLGSVWFEPHRARPR